jgi:hypothetical protein
VVANNVGSNFMKTCCANAGNGTLIEDFILGKRDYIESRDPGVTTYAAQMNFAWRPSPTDGTHTGTAKPGFVQDNTKPTVDFIANEIKKGEDVEVFLANDINHYVTLTGITFETTTGKGTLSYVDPEGGGRFTDPIPGLDNGFIEVTYHGTEDTVIAHAVSESVVPEPSTLLLLGTGLSMVAGYYRRGRRQARRETQGKVN